VTEKPLFLKNSILRNSEETGHRIDCGMETRRGAARRRNVVPIAAAIPVAEVVPAMIVMLRAVAERKGLLDNAAESWVDAVFDKFGDIGVETLRDFVTDMVVLNQRLLTLGHTKLHKTTLTMMLEETASVLQWPD
jgi:hypothetical protein